MAVSIFFSHPSFPANQREVSSGLVLQGDAGEAVARAGNICELRPLVSGFEFRVEGLRFRLQDCKIRDPGWGLQD